MPRLKPGKDGAITLGAQRTSLSSKKIGNQVALIPDA
jgi:hypothetical protein